MLGNSKKTIGVLVGIICLILVLLLVVGINYLSHKSSDDIKTSEREKNEEYKIKLEFYPASLIVTPVSIDLTSSEEKELRSIINKFDIDKDELILDEVEMDSSIRYRLTYKDNVLYFREDDKVVNYNGKAVIMKKGYDELMTFVNKKNTDRQAVYAYKIPACVGTTCDDPVFMAGFNPDYEKIKEVWDKNPKKVTPAINLQVAVAFVVVIGNDVVYLNDELTYGYFKGELFPVSADFKFELDGGGCCSMCPDLKPGEACADVCVSCFR